MGKHCRAAFVLVPFVFSLAAGCGSDSGSGGSACQNLAGTYQDATTTCLPLDTTTVTQTGCNATISIGGTAVSGTVSGNRFTAPNVSCSVSISGASYSIDCTQKDPTGQSTTCHTTGTVSDRPVQSGAGGAGTLGAGGSGTAGTGVGSGGTGSTAMCGVDWSQDASCNGCMTTSCCNELKGCGPGTACDAFLVCVSTQCSSGDDTCIQSKCSAQIQAASAAVSALEDCDTQKCQGCS